MQASVYDLRDPVTLADPYPALAVLRERTPVFWHEPSRSWALTRYDDCLTVLRDHTWFARDLRRAGRAVPRAGLSVQSMDPPQQAPVRQLFHAALRAQDLDRLQELALRRAVGCLAAAGPGFDVMTGLAAPVALTVVAALLGVDEPDPAVFGPVSDTIMRSMDAGLDPALAEPGRLAREQLTALVDSWFAASGRPGLLSHVRAHAGDEPGTNLVVRNTARVMLQGGYSTMVAAIGNTVHTLLRHPGVLKQLADPARLAGGVEELVRYDGPVQGSSRIALRPCRLGGVTIAEGDTVLALLAAANRDPARFPHPDRLILDRVPGRHLDYGWGVHACLATVVAQRSLRAVVTALAGHDRVLVPAGEARRRRTATMRVFATLPARFV